MASRPANAGAGIATWATSVPAGHYITLQSERKSKAALETPQVTPGWKAVDFHFKGTDEKFYTLADVRGPRGLVVMFISNHCPFVQAIASKLTRDTKDLAAIGIGGVAIMSNE